MRISLMVMVVAASTMASAALALQPRDTMAAWHAASSDEKGRLVAELLRHDGSGGSPAGIIACLDAASNVDGHADLPIAEVAKACRNNSGDPV